MVSAVTSLLEKYNAHATFFVCSDYCNGDDTMRQATRDLVRVHGHELGNHMAEDKCGGHYSKMNEWEFRTEFERVNGILEGLVNNDPDDDTAPYAPIRWFRAPQGVFTRAMHRVLSSSAPQDSSGNNDPIIHHVLGDCYCDDWALASKDPLFVVRTMKRQVKEGSVAILHMPERGTEREATLVVLETLLRDWDQMGYRCVSLGEMWEACDGRHAHSAAALMD